MSLIIESPISIVSSDDLSSIRSVDDSLAFVVFCFNIGLLALCFLLAFGLLDYPSWMVFCVGVGLSFVFFSLAVKFTCPWD